MIRFPLFVILSVAATPAVAETFSGVGRAIDGDSLTVGETEVRLYGVDAPELTQTCQRAGRQWECGSDAKVQLAKLIDGKKVSCSSLGGDTFGRTLARCRVGESEINRTTVATGYALAYRRYSMDYVSAEESAKLARRGIWAGTFEPPAEVRHALDDYVIDRSSRDKGEIGSSTVVFSSRSRGPSAGGCKIKGNHSRKGERIYHLPGMPYYAETIAEEMFCTEAQARAAGYRRSRADQHR